MRRRLNSINLVIALFLVLMPARGFALENDPGQVEVGDTGTFYIPLENHEASLKVIRNARASLTGVPSWMDIDQTSFIGPVDIYPGEIITFTVDFTINAGYNPASPNADIAINLVSDSLTFVPSSLTWHFTTANGFKTAQGESTDNSGFAYSQYRSLDVLAPNTFLNFGGPFYNDAEESIFLSTQTLIYFEGSDSYEANAEISRVAATGYRINSPAATFEELNISTDPVLLAEGQHTLYFASRDNAGNTEVIKSSVVYVDALAPTVDFEVAGSSSLAGNGAMVISSSSLISLTGADAGVGDLVSGLNRRMYSVDVLYSSATAIFYSVPFMLPVGAHTVYYTAYDNVENQSEVKSISIVVGNTNVACGGTITENTILAADLDCSEVTGVALTINADNVVLDGNNHKIIAPNAVWVVNANDRTNITVKNVDLSGNPGLWQGTGLRISYSKSSLIENVTAHNRDVGLNIASGNSNSVLRNNNLSDNRTAIQVGGATMTVTGNNFSNSVVGLSAGGSNLILGNDNNFSGSTTAVVLVNLTDSVIENLVLNNPKAILGGSSKRLVFRNLDLSGLGGVGLEFNYTEDSVYENITAHNRDIGLNIAGGNSNSIIRNNNLSANNIALQVGGSSMTISGNILSNSASGLSAGGSNLILESNNDFSGSTAAVVLVNLTDSVIEDLVLSNPKAIWGGAAKRLVFRNLDLSGIGGSGLEFNYTENSIYENIVVHNRDVGLNIAAGNSNSIIRNNSLSSNRIALQVGGATMTVTGNILSNSVTGLAAAGSNLIIGSNNDFSGSTTAVFLGYLTDSVIENLVLNNPKGIAGGASKRLVFRNLDLSGPGGIGLEFNATEDSVYENITAHNRDVGLSISGGCSNSIIRNNDLSGNNLALQVGGSTITVTGNILSNSVAGLGAGGSNLILKSDNNFSGSTTAVFLANLIDSVIEDLVLNNPKGIAGGASKRLTFRNMDLSGPGGIGLEFNYAEDNIYENITAHNRDTGLNISYGNKNSIIRNNNLSHNNIALQVTGTTLTVINNKLDSSTLGLNAVNVYNLIINNGNDFAGSTTAISIGIGEGVILEDLILNNPLAVNIFQSKTITLRNLNLSGPAGIAAGTGMRVSDSSNINIIGILVANRDIGIKMDGVCTGNLVGNNTIANNNTGLLLMQPCSGVSIVNSVIWGNLDDLQDQTGLNQVSYSNVQEALLPGEGNIHADPLFIDVAVGDYRLRTGSSGIDAGINAVAGLSVTDLGGNLRVIDGDDDGNAVIDMGAYESQTILPIINNISPSSGTVSSTFTILGSGFGAYSAVTSQVFVGTTSASIVSWTSTVIQGTVPDVLIPGVYPVVVERELDGSLVQTSTISFTVISIVSVSSDGFVSIITSEANLSVAAISTETIPSTATVFSAMSGAGLVPVLGAFYELEPSGIQFTVPAKLTFTFNPVDIDTATVAIYYYDNVGLVWTSAAIYNQLVTFNPDGSATVEGEIYHTSLYALLHMNPVSPAMLYLNPEVLNIKSKGEAITAVLNTANNTTGCFKRDTIKIYKVNGQSLAHPVFAQAQKGKEYTLDCGSATVKFSREAVIAVLPVNAVATITVSGFFTDGRIFQAEDTIRTINPVRASEAGDVFTVSADSSFRLGEVYVYPNPAKGGKVPTFHVEVGLADIVKIRVYTVAGQLAYERLLTGTPQIVGAAYAYEYAWEGRISSGVYYYTIEAEKAGSKLKAKGKFAVVR